MKLKKMQDKKSRKPSSALKKKIGRALQKIRFEAHLSRDDAAEVIGMPATDFENLERGIGRMLTPIDAKHIQAATGVSAASLMKGDAWPVMLNDKHFTLEGFTNWRNHAISEESRIAQTQEIAMMSELLLETAGKKGASVRRRAYHLLRETLEEIRKSSGISMAEIHEQAMKGAQFSTHQATRDQLDQAIGQAPAYQAIRGKLPVEGLIEVAQDAFQTWCDLSAFDSILPEVPDCMEVTRVIYRLKIGEHWHTVIADQFSGRGVGSNQRASKLKRSIGKAIPY
jgi:transcriptional regulator with XRE-family HTH domain